MAHQAERLGRWALWSVVSGVVSLLLLALQTPLTEFAGMRVSDRLQVSLSGSSNTIVDSWVFLLSSVITAVIAIVAGLYGARTASVTTARLARIGLLLGVLSIGSIAVWELCGGYFGLFWAI
jgi:hypothetical protein